MPPTFEGVDIPRADPLVSAAAFWAEIDKTVDDRTAGDPTAPRIYGINVPFGVAGTPLAITTPTLLLPLGTPTPALITGWRLWVRPAGSVTVDVRMVDPNVDPTTETSIVGSTLPAVASSQYAFSNDLSTWGITQVFPDDLLLFYLTAASTAENGLFWLVLRDQTVQPHPNM